MNEIETLEDFYEIKFSDRPVVRQQGIGDFNVFVMEDVIHSGGRVAIKYTRRDFYKICLCTGANLFHHADKTVRVDGTSLLFFNPQTPYKWEPLSDNQAGYFCIFKEAFFSEKLRSNLGTLPVFNASGKPSYLLNNEQGTFVADIFKKMVAEMNSDFKYKQDLLLSYVTELVYYALKLDPSENLYQTPDAKSRITNLFTDLLDRQFPIISPQERLHLRSPKDYAQHLYLHVNYLNDAVKTTTGKTTSKLVAERVITEAKIMLKHSDWNVAEVGYALGFEDAAHFNNFFKKNTKISPAKFRVKEAALVG
ncbi:helix-turn-helix domain-containing protein [Mucilaginibacter sp. CSA2-8R]|uniref:AraC family transcriptional regulator n=1 Tax=Mucilaginibacter sp. CSA2-8R TaxID=3141542 RepID=UPI00315C8010